MSCRIKLHEMNRATPPAHVTLRSPTVQLLAVEQASLSDCCPVQTNRRLIGGGYGADLPFIPASFVYQVAIIDAADAYAGATIANLNGAVPGDLDVVLFRLPVSGAVPAVATPAQIRETVLINPSWNIEEKQAVLSVMNALCSLRGTAANPVLGFIAHYERTLVRLGISPVFF
jgi:hypothetical protein